MQQHHAAISLPPLVEGPPRGALRVSLGAVRWGPDAPPALQHSGPLAARLHWWGDINGAPLLPLPAAGESAEEARLSFTLRTGPKYFTRYLRDAGALTISVEAASGSGLPGDAAAAKAAAAPLAVATVGLLALDVQAALSGSYPLVLPATSRSGDSDGSSNDSSAVIVGSLPVRLELDYSSESCGSGGGELVVVSSFELQEHLANMDAAAEAADAVSGGSTSGADAVLDAPGVCRDLAAALEDRERAEAIVQELVDEAETDDGMQPLALGPRQLADLLPLLLPAGSTQQAEYGIAMLLTCTGASSLSLDELAAAAAECAAVERRLQEQPAPEALRCLRQLAAALGSRSLDLATAFADAEGGHLSYTQLAALVQRLHLAATAQEARCLLALLAAPAAGGDAIRSGVTLPDVKAALVQVLEAQQFPTAEDLQRQQAVVEARRAKEAAAAAAAVIEQQRAAAAAAAREPPSEQQYERRLAVVGKLKSSLQRRRRSTSSSQQVEVPADGGSAGGTAASIPEQTEQPQLLQAVQPPTVVVGIPVLTPPPPALPVPAAAAPPAVVQNAAAEVPAPAAETAAAAAPVVSGPRRDALLQLIQQAEELKAALQPTGGGSNSGSAACSLWNAAAAAAAGPRLPNLLLPPGGSSAVEEVAAGGGLSAATAALLEAARTLRREGDLLPALALTAGPVPPAAAAAVAVAPAVAAAASLEDSSDAESDAEDALLESLFFRPSQQLLHQPVPATDLQELQQPEAAAPPPAQPQLVLRVQLQALQLASGSLNSVRCVVKALRSGGQAQQLTMPVAAAGSGAVCHAEVPLPAAAAREALPPYLFLEFWQHSGSLLGVAKVPLLQLCSTCSSSGAAIEQPVAAVVAEGWQAIHNILEGRDAGSLHVAAVLQERGTVPLAAAVRHYFDVRIHSALRLPSAAAYAAAGLRAPDSRLLRYSFPGEPDALQTGEVPCCSNPTFEATASHELVLPAAQCILPQLAEGLLRFELFDCWADKQQRQQHGWALLQLSELGSLVAEAERSGSLGGGPSGGREASRALLLPLCTEYDTAAEAATDAAPAAALSAAAAPHGPSLQIELNYRTLLCTMDAAEAAVMVAAPGAAAGAREQTAASPAKAAAAHDDGASSSDSDEENSLRLVNGGSTLRRPSQLPQPAAAAHLVAAAPAAAPASEPREPFVPATLSVEIIRASGLVSAVREAAAATGGSSMRFGPHAFARLALFTRDPRLQAQAPPLQTAFVPQSFCPAWRAAHTYPLQLTADLLGALATQSMRVEVWHRCPRAAGAGGVGGSSGGQRELLLGGGSASLLDILRKPQGMRCWVPLAPPSSSGQGQAAAGSGNVGAVQIAVRLTSLGSLSTAASSSEALLLRNAEAMALLPPRLHGPLLAPPGAGFVGQRAVTAVHLDLLVPPSSSGSGRPRADRFLCRYSLPGASSVCTAARVLTCVGGGGRGPPAAGGRHGSEPQRWAAKLNHVGFFAVAAGPALTAALLHGPLLVQVYKQPAAAESSTVAGSRSAVLVGSAEIDLSPLLWSGSDGKQAEQQRSLGGSYPLVEGVAASQGGASLAARVQLQLLPATPAAEQAAAAAAAGADATAAVWELEGNASSQHQQLPAAGGDSAGVEAEQQRVPPPPPSQQQPEEECLVSSSDDEYNEELLRRCQRLATAAAAPAPPADPATATLDSGSQAGEHQAAANAGDAGEASLPQQSSQAAEGAAAAEAAAPAAPPAQQQGNSTPAAGGRGEPTVQQQERQRPAPVDAGEAEGALLLHVETALHLPAMLPAAAAGASASSNGYSAYVQAVWGEQRQHQQRTPAVPVHVVAAGDLGGTAVWNAELELPASAATWAVRSGAGGSGGTAGTNLLLNMWAIACGSDGGSARSAGGNCLSSAAAAAADTLLGCAVLDLSLLPRMPQQAGWWHIVDSQQRLQGQLKVTLRPSTALLHALQAQAPAASEPAELASAAAAPVAPLAAPAAAGQQHGEQPPAGDLMLQLAAQLEELELLSHRLGAAPPVTAIAAAAPATVEEAAASTAAVAPAAAPAATLALEETASAAEAAAAAFNSSADTIKLYDELPASDDEALMDMAPFDTRQEGFAWSGSDSDDGMHLLGVAIDGAVSPGFTDDDAEVDARQQAREPRQPALLLDDDWMFSICQQPMGQPQHAEPSPADAAAAAGGELGGGDAQQQASSRRHVAFRNVIPGGALGTVAITQPRSVAATATGVSPSSSAAQPERQALPARHSTSVATTAAPMNQWGARPAVAGAPPAAAAATAAAAARAPPAAATAAAAAAAEAAHRAPIGLVQLQQPLPRQQQLAASAGLQPGWQFEISRGPVAGVRSSEPPPASGQFAAMPASPPQGSGAGIGAGSATPAALLAQQRQQLAERSLQQRSPGAAATIDEILSALRGGRCSERQG